MRKNLIWIGIILAYLSPISEANPELLNLETKIWTAEDHQLLGLEKKIVKTIQSNSDSAFSHYLLSHLYMRLFSMSTQSFHYFQNSIQLAKQAIQIDPRNKIGYVALANIYDVMGEIENAEKTLAEGEVNASGLDWRGYFTLARLKASGPSLSSEVLKSLQKTMMMPGANQKILSPYIVAVIQAAHEDPKIYAEHMLTWRKKFPNQTFRLFLAEGYVRSGKHRAAHSEYRKLYLEFPNLAEAKISDAIILYQNLSKPRQATRLFQQAIKHYKNKPKSYNKSIVYAHLARIQIQKKAFKKAQLNFLESLRYSTNTSQTITFIKQSYRSHYAFKEMIQTLKKTHFIAPGFASIHALIAETYASDLKSPKKSLKHFQDAIILDESKSEYLGALGLAYYQINDLEKALHSFSKATQINPIDAVAFYNKACVLSLLGRKDESLYALKEALNISPHLQRIAINDSDLNMIRNHLQFKDLMSQFESLSQVP